MKMLEYWNAKLENLVDLNAFNKIQRRFQNIIPEFVFKGGFKHLKMNDPIHFGKND